MIRAALALFLLASPAAALDLNLPSNARQTVERNTSPDIYAAPIGPYAGGKVPMLTIEGDVRRAAWRIESPGLTPLQVMRPLRAQLVQEGFEIILDCASTACGGFDFRFATETLPGPNMYVNLRAYHFITAVRGGDKEVVTVLASTSATSAYVQIIQAGAVAEDVLVVYTDVETSVALAPTVPGDLGQEIMAQGHVVLGDLDFETGSTDLGPGPFTSLEQLATFLRAQPALRVALVGHTDTVGSLDGNITISRQRAQSVRQRLMDRYDIAGDRLDAEGMGYLAPVASNLDAAGRDRNRRVEVVLLGGG